MSAEPRKKEPGEVTVGQSSRSEKRSPGQDRLQVESALQTLVSLTHRLQVLGVTITISACISLILLALAATIRRTLADYHLDVIVHVLGILCALLGIVLLVLWEGCRKEGMGIYEEISDEFEWHHRTFRPRQELTKESKNEHVDLQVRLILRRFISNSGLTFVSHIGNPAMVYVAFFLMCMAFFVLFSVLRGVGD